MLISKRQVGFFLAVYMLSASVTETRASGVRNLQEKVAQIRVLFKL